MMRKLPLLGFVHQSGAKLKDGKYPNQNKGRAKPNPAPIYCIVEHGDYGNEAHHYVSGNEIMKGCVEDDGKAKKPFIPPL